MKAFSAFVLVLSFFTLSSLALAGETEATAKLSNAFDDVFLNHKLSPANLKDFNKGAATKVIVEVDNNTYDVTARFIKTNSAWHLRRFDNIFISHNTPDAKLNCKDMTFSITYAYPNTFNSIVDYRFDFSGEIIKRLCEEDTAQSNANSSSEDDGDAVFADACDAVVVHDSVGDESESGSGDESDSDSKEIGHTGLLGVLQDRLDKVSRLTSLLGSAACESDHLYNLVAGSLRGGFGILSAISNRDIGDGLVAFCDLAAAAKSGCRAYQSIFGASQRTQVLFNKLDGNLGLIGSLTKETQDVLTQIRADIENVNLRLEETIRTLQPMLVQLASNRTTQSEETLAQIKDLDNALRQLEEAKRRLASFSAAAASIEATWNRANNLLQKLDEAFQSPIEDKKEFQERLSSMQEYVGEIRVLLLSLKQPWGIVKEAFSELARLNEVFSGCISKQSTFCLNILKQNAEIEQLCSNQQAAIECLEKGKQANLCVGLKNEKAMANTCKILDQVDSAKGNVIVLKAEVDKKYDLVHLIVGAAGAIASTFILSGTLPPVAAGLFVAQIAKTIDNACCVDEDNELTWFGRLLWGSGVSKDTVKALGRRCLGRDYASDKPKDPPKDKDGSKSGGLNA